MNKTSKVDSSTGFSVSLKFAPNSVLLYRNGYSKKAGEKGGASTQKFICSFSNKCTEIPPKFDEYLRQATADKPERYAEMIERINTRVLEPAKKKAQEQQLEAQNDRMKGWFSFALQKIEYAVSSPDRELILENSDIQKILKKLVAEANSILLKPSNKEMNDGASAEKKVFELLEKINESYTLIIKIMSDEKKYFSRDYQFSEETIEQVRKIWFNASDANSALTMYEQLHRPKNWTQMRVDVMGH